MLDKEEVQGTLFDVNIDHCWQNSLIVSEYKKII